MCTQINCIGGIGSFIVLWFGWHSTRKSNLCSCNLSCKLKASKQVHGSSPAQIHNWWSEAAFQGLTMQGVRRLLFSKFNALLYVVWFSLIQYFSVEALHCSDDRERFLQTLVSHSSHSPFTWPPSVALHSASNGLCRVCALLCHSCHQICTQSKHHVEPGLAIRPSIKYK